MEESIKFCKLTYLVILEKQVAAFDNIPTSILEKFPGFESATYIRLKSLRQRLKALITLKNSSLNKLRLQNNADQLTEYKSSDNSSQNRFNDLAKPINNVVEEIVDHKSSFGSLRDESDDELSDLLPSKKYNTPPKRVFNFKSSSASKKQIDCDGENIEPEISTHSYQDIIPPSPEVISNSPLPVTKSKPIEGINKINVMPIEKLRSPEISRTHSFQNIIPQSPVEIYDSPLPVTKAKPIVPIEKLRPSSPSILNNYCPEVLNISNDALQNINENDSNEPAQIKPKGKFVFKRPSALTSLDTSTINIIDSPARDIPSNTLNRMKLATMNLKPVPEPEARAPKDNNIYNSSAPFLPLRQDPVMTCAVKPCAMVSPIRNETFANTPKPAPQNLYDISNYTFDSDEEEQANLLNEPDLESDLTFGSFDRNSKNNFTSNKNREPIRKPNESPPMSQPILDDEGWPEYRIEDFEDCQIVAKSPAPSVSAVRKVTNPAETTEKTTNSMDSHTAMGNFHSSVKNDGRTGNKITSFQYSSTLLKLFVFYYVFFF